MGVRGAFADRPDVTITDRAGPVEQGVNAQRLAFVVLSAMFGVALTISVVSGGG